MDIQHTDDGLKGKFFITRNDKELAEMTYVWVGTEKIIIDHTEVDKAFGGKGLAKELVFAGAAYARENSKKIIPLCPYAKATFEKYEELQDLLF